MNPIELIFGIWKARAYPAIKDMTDKRQILKKLGDVFTEIDACEVRRCINHVMNVIWPKVRNVDDI